jgi:hypothetical protein
MGSMKWERMSAEQRQDAVHALMDQGATRTDLMNALDGIVPIEELQGALKALVEAGRAVFTEGGLEGFDLWTAVTPPDAKEEETRDTADRRLLRRITHARRAEINEEDAELSREEAGLEVAIASKKERLKAIHQKRMDAALASKNDTEYADVPCREVLRFASGLAITVRCDPSEEWPLEWPTDGSVGDPRKLTEADLQTVLPMADGAVDMAAIADLAGAGGVEPTPAKKRPGRSKKDVPLPKDGGAL